jgi:hypothetical protein
MIGPGFPPAGSRGLFPVARYADSRTPYNHIVSPSARTGCLVAFGLPLAILAVYAGNTAMRLHALDAPRGMVLIYGCVAAAFGIFGLGLLATAWRGRRREASADPRRISDQGPALTPFVWGFALVWNVIAIPLTLVFVPDAMRGGEPLGWLTLLFPIAGAGMIIAAIRLTIRGLRFRESTLVLDTLPVPIGGRLRGHVEVSHPLTSVSKVMIRLTALSRTRSGSKTFESIVCDEKRELPLAQIRRNDEGSIVPVEISVPASAPASDTTNAIQIYWRLTVDAELPGVDYKATFDVPVVHDAFAIHSPAKL